MGSARREANGPLALRQVECQWRAVQTGPVTALADWLTGPDGAGAIVAAEALLATGADPLAAATSLRSAPAHLTPEQASAALTQASLRRTAAERYGLTDPGLLTRDGLEQATRPEVAAARASLIAAAHPARVIDATAGLGFDTRAIVGALAPHGIPVLAVERDLEVAAFLRANVPGAEVIVGDAIDVLPTLSIGPADVVFVDPARRDHRRSADGTRAQPERDPERWSPPWSWVVALAATTRVCAKVSPGFAPGALPPGWCAQWTSWRRMPVEAFLCSWAALPHTRRAIAADTGAVIDGDDDAACSIGPVGEWLHEVDPAVVAAGLVDDLACRHDGVHRIDAQPHWLTGTRALIDPLLRSFRVIAELPASTKELRRALRARGIGSVTVKTRGGRRDAERVRGDLHLDGHGATGTIIATDVAGRPSVYLVESP